MFGRADRTGKFRRLVPVAILAAVLAAPASAQSPPGQTLIEAKANELSQSALMNYWLAHPDSAPPPVRERLGLLTSSARAHPGPQPGPTAPVAPVPEVFNQDISGLPQNEESVAVCRSNPDVLLGGTNDYREVLEGKGVGTGWHFSADGGTTVANEGRLPALTVAGIKVPSAGDPVVHTGGGCRLYAVDLNFSAPLGPYASAIGLYATSPSNLASCPGGSAPSCWPVRRAVKSTTSFDVFLDKPWFDVGRSGAAGEVVWVTYTSFRFTSAGFTIQIKAVRCNSDLTTCTAPIPISGADPDVQFSYVTIGPDGRVYVTWSQIAFGTSGPQFIHKLRVAEPGATTFGPTRVIHNETMALTFLQANDFRVATQAKSAVRIVNGRPRVFVTWDACRIRTTAGVCEETVVKLRYSDNFGATWSTPLVLSAGGVNYFPTIADDPAGPRLALAWYTNRFDPQFLHSQDVELVALDPVSAAVVSRQRVTTASNEPDADPALGGFFIGDYIQVVAHGGQAYVHFNANYRRSPIAGEGVPVNQQDNFLARRSL